MKSTYLKESAPQNIRPHRPLNFAFKTEDKADLVQCSGKYGPITSSLSRLVSLSLLCTSKLDGAERSGSYALLIALGRHTARLHSVRSQNFLALIIGI